MGDTCGTRGISSALAIALKHNPDALFHKAGSAARQAGYCQERCSADDVHRWAVGKGEALNGPLGAYALALASKCTATSSAASQEETAAQVVTILGYDACKTFTLAVQLARQQAFCDSRLCSPVQLQRWSRAVNTENLASPLQFYANALAARVSGELSVGIAMAAALKKNSTSLYLHAAALAKQKGFCNASKPRPSILFATINLMDIFACSIRMHTTTAHQMVAKQHRNARRSTGQIHARANNGPYF